MRKTVSRFVSLLFAATVGVVGMATSPAQAAMSNCPGARLCIWDAINYSGNPTGSWTINTIAAQPGGCLQLSGSNYRTASSIYWNGSFISFSSFTLWGINGANRGISTNGYADSNMLTSPGIASFSNSLQTICANN